MHPRTTIAGLLLLLPLFGCGGEDATSATPSPTPSPVTATISSVSGSASSANAVPSPESAYQWSTNFTVTLAETAGVATTVRSLTATLQQAAGGIIITPPSPLAESYRFNVRAGTNQLAASSTLPIEFDFFYTLPNGGRQALITVTFTLVDANGAQSTVAVQVTVV